jgi:hypothetical protein
MLAGILSRETVTQVHWLTACKSGFIFESLHEMERTVKILRVLAALFIFGGLVRLFANQSLFALFHMESLWSDHQYFLYVYRVLGAFVVLTGMVIYAVSIRPDTMQHLFTALACGFILVGLVMAVSGYMIGLHPAFYLPDFLFTLLLAFLFYRMKRKS